MLGDPRSRAAKWRLRRAGDRKLRKIIEELKHTPKEGFGEFRRFELEQELREMIYEVHHE